MIATVFIRIMLLVLLAYFAQSECLDFADQFSHLKTSQYYEKCLAAMVESAGRIGLSNPRVVESVLEHIKDDDKSDHVDIIEGHRVLLREIWRGDEKSIEVGLVDGKHKQAISLNVACKYPEMLMVGLGHESKVVKLICNLKNGIVSSVH
jgi:hypothetical protein